MKTIPHIRIRIPWGEEFAIGPGKADLLEAIQRSGSISAAARELNMSYRRAWLLVNSMNQCFRTPLVDTATGGHSGGGARLSPLGQEVLRRFRTMEHKAAEAVNRDAQELARHLAPRAAS